MNHHLCGATTLSPILSGMRAAPDLTRLDTYRLSMDQSPTSVTATTTSFAQPHLPFDAPAAAKAQGGPPKRCVSAYNLFFQVERQRLISNAVEQGPYTRAEVYAIKIDKATRIEKSKRPHRKMHGVISFTDLAKTIAQKWKDLDAAEKRLFEERAEDEKKKYAVELEEWLLRQVPTQQIRKRLSALRRGSLSKYISHRKESPVPSPAPTPVASPPVKQIHGISPYPSSCSLVGSSTSLSMAHPAPPVSPDQSNRRQIQVARARNLQRLYQMQIDLYNAQMRLHDECKADLAMLKGEMAQEPELPFLTPLEVEPETPVDNLGTAAFASSSHLPSTQTEFFDPLLPTSYFASPFHAEGRVSPFDHETEVFA